MSGRTLNGAIAVLVLGNFLAMFSDVLINWQGGDIPIFQFVFMRVSLGDSGAAILVAVQSQSALRRR